MNTETSKKKEKKIIMHQKLKQNICIQNEKSHKWGKNKKQNQIPKKISIKVPIYKNLHKKGKISLNYLKHQGNRGDLEAAFSLYALQITDIHQSLASTSHHHCC